MKPWTEVPYLYTISSDDPQSIQRKARQTGRPTDELIQLYALECFLDRLTQSAFAGNLVLKGGVLLAAFDARRPTRDIDLAASSLRNTEAEILTVVREIAAISLDDGVAFDPERAAAEIIREEDDYSGIRQRSAERCLVPPFAYTSM
jgi:hypothetical protein